MRKVISARETTEVGRCIYCGEVEGKLSEEHVTPYGLSGLLVLRHASCGRCAKITSQVEARVLKHMSAARAALGTRTRHPKERRKPQPMLVEKDGEVREILAPWQEQWKVIQLPIFRFPACIDGRPYSSGIERVSQDQFELTERADNVAKKHDANRVIKPDYPVEDFARFIAKTAYGYAVAWYTLKCFEEVYVVRAILGESNDIGRWVGCSDRREFPVRECNVSVGFGIIPGDELLVKIKMFPKFDGAEYVAVVGRVKEVYVNYIQSTLLT
jgi:hypothetical protein